MFDYETNKNAKEKNNKESQNQNKETIDTPYRSKENSIDDISQEDSTKYGEFISSYFGWMTLDTQKKRASELEKMTNNNNYKGKQ